MPNKSRGVTLTIFALLFLLMAISNLGKPFSHQTGVGFVFLGERLSGVPNMIIAPIFGIILAARMRTESWRCANMRCRSGSSTPLM